MAKKEGKTAPQDALEQLDQLGGEGADLWIVTTSGRRVQLCPVSHVLLRRINRLVEREYRERGEPVDPPKYVAKLAGGGEQEFEHDESTLEYPLALALDEAGGDEGKAALIAERRTRENRAVWLAHKAALARMGTEITRRRTEFMLRRGVAFDEEVPPEWAEDLRGEGFEVPEDPAALRIMYIECELLMTPGDMLKALGKIAGASAAGVPEDMVQGALDFFRREVAGGDAAAGPPAGEGAGLLDDEPAGGGG